MAEFGWSYISCGDVLTGSGGPHGAVQFKTPGGIDGSAAFIYDTGSNRVGIGLDWPNMDGNTLPDAALHVVGDVSVTGTIYATEYQILNVTRVEEEGSTKFGTNADDDHEFTGSLKVNGTLTTNGTVTLGDASDDVITSTGKLTASAGILIPDSENATDPTNTTVGLHLGTGADLSIYHNGTNSHIANATGDLKIQSTVNSAECILIRANGGTSETIKIYSDQGTAGNSITLASDAGGILFNLDATSGKKIHADVESTDADSIHLDSEGGIKLESDAHPVNITGDLVVSGSSIILGNADTDVISLTGQVTASAGILIPDADAVDKTLQIGTGGDFYIAHDGTDTALTNATGKLKITSTVNAAEAIRIRANGGTDETIKIYSDQGTGTDSISLVSDAGGVTVEADLYVTQKIVHVGDTDTYIDFTTDDINFQVGGVNFLDLTEDTQNEVTFNEGGADVDFRVESADESHMLFIEGSSNRMSIGDNTGSPGATLEVKNHASAGATGVPLVQLNSNDTDQQCLDINASNITANVVNITANDVTTARVLAIGADGLTTGNAFYVDDNSADTGTRNTAIVIQNNAAAIAATAFTVQSDGGITGIKLDKNFSDTTAATVTGLNIDFDKTGASTSNNTMYGLNIDMDNTTATNGNNYMYGLHVTPTLTHAADAGGAFVYGALINAQGGTNGSSLITGARVEAGGGDINYGLQLDVEDGGVDLRIESSADSGDYFQIQTTTHGATTITTVDDDAAAADLTFTIDGDIILGPAGGDVLPDGDNTRNLGSAAKRWANIYTGDLHLKNDRGDWTIVEEEDFLCVINNKTGKKFKMNLIPLEDDE